MAKYSSIYIFNNKKHMLNNNYLKEKVYISSLMNSANNFLSVY
jgi:hypothetical protein